MLSITFKILLALFVLIYFLLYYEQIYEYAKSHGFRGDGWMNISKFGQEECSCDGGKTRNCFPHLSEMDLCGQCFETCYDSSQTVSINLHDQQEIELKDELAFALAASQLDVNKLLVLVASIHRNFPKTKLLIFDTENTTFLQNQLISIRNVEVIRIMKPGNVVNGILTPFYLQEAIKRFTRVLWIPVASEFHNNKLVHASGFGKASKALITYISRDTSRKIGLYGNQPYFPTTSTYDTFPLSILVKNGAKDILNWAERCALDAACWKCETPKGLIEDCTWQILYRIAYETKQLRVVEDFSQSLQKQSWSPPECGFYCALYMVSVTIVAVIGVGALALLMFRRATTTKKAK